MKLKIVSDGTTRGTQVVDAETGEVLEGVIGVSFSANISSSLAHAKVELQKVPFEFTGSADVARYPD